MSSTQRSRRGPLAGVLAIVGGTLLAVGSFLTWAEVSGGGGTSLTARGVDDSRGYMTLALGVIALLVGIVMMRDTSRVLAVLAVVAGLVGSGIGLYEALTTEERVVDTVAEELAPDLGASAEQVRAALDEAIDAGQLSVTISIGLYVVIAGGVLALVGGILGLPGTATEPVAAGGFTSSQPEATIAGGDVPTAPMPPPAASPPPGDGDV